MKVEVPPARIEVSPALFPTNGKEKTKKKNVLKSKINASGERS